ncbi:GNAT family N-acetyltransferase [Teredinibacter turnerae]|uniref:GNAT family N-acetyltransferase n=1 Tax=Teredinibacter turnerae TaxID=2426 RepID=UPI0003825268|nr:GNAT family N-acetyltransferase [Teredinibacter turnerae]
MQIVTAKPESQLAADLFLLLKNEWLEFEDFHKEKLGLRIPDPIVCLIEGTVIGGLSFTGFENPINHETAIWINAVFVSPKFRRLGIASRLIEKSHGEAPELFALTDIPELYTQLGWTSVSTGKSGTIVRHT